MTPYEPILTQYIGEPNSYTLDFYLKNQRGYEGLRKALTLKPNDIIDQVKASGLRGRGGAGFQTGLKWQFVLKDTPKPKYICCNADESEPGTFKDHVLMERNPHLMIEGCAVAAYAVGAKVVYIYIRGEFYHVQEILEAEIEKAYAAGYLGRNVSSGADSIATSTCTAARAPMRRGKRRRSSNHSKASARSPGSNRRFRPWPVSISARRRSTTSRHCATCRSSC